MLTQRGPAPYLINHVAGRGAIARFDQDTAQVLSVLDMLKAGGADGISLSPWLWQGIGDNDQYLDWTPATGRLVPKMEANFVRLLQSITAAGFHWIQVAPQFYDPNPLRVQTTENRSWPRNVGMDAFVGTNLFFDWLTKALDATGIDWMLDLVPEHNDVYPNNPPFQQYVKDTWARMTSIRSPGGVPCWNYSMSFTMANFDALVDAFQGNAPAILLPHPYNADLLWLHEDLDSRGLGTIPWISGEDYTLGEAGDENYVQKYVAFVQRTRQLIMGVCPWPILTTWEKDDPFLAPPRAPTLWNTM